MIPKDVLKAFHLNYMPGSRNIFDVTVYPYWAIYDHAAFLAGVTKEYPCSTPIEGLLESAQDVQVLAAAQHAALCSDADIRQAAEAVCDAILKVSA